jgi:hypothetical protein
MRLIILPSRPIMEILTSCVILRPAQCAVLLLNEVIKHRCNDIFIAAKSILKINCSLGVSSE